MHFKYLQDYKSKGYVFERQRAGDMQEVSVVLKQ